MDMSQSLAEIARVLKTNAPLVIVLGRESNVLGASFKNGALIQQILRASGAFENINVYERVFTSRFGTKIYEDIFVAERARFSAVNLEDARAVGVSALRGARSIVSDKNRATLEAAIDRSGEVESSRLLTLSIPKLFTDSGQVQWKSFEPPLTATS
jgi:hypothetical protein